jgi:hypothetical protein
MPNLNLEAGTAIARFTGGANSGKYTHYTNAGANGQGICAGFLPFDLVTDAAGNVVRKANPYGTHEVFEDSTGFYRFRWLFSVLGSDGSEPLKIFNGTTHLTYTGNEAAFNTMFEQLGRVQDGVLSMT